MKDLLVQQLVENSPNAIFSIDRQGLLQTWNPACEILFGYGREILGQEYRILFHQMNATLPIDELVSRVFEKGSSFSDIELLYRDSRGELIFMNSRVFPLFGEKGNVQACVFANTNITEHKQTEQTLRRQVRELSVLHAIASACSTINAEDELIETVTGIIGQSFHPDKFGILLLDESEQVLYIHPSYFGWDKLVQNAKIPLDYGSVGFVVRTKKPCRIADTSENCDYLPLFPTTRSQLNVPIKVSDLVLGVVNTESKEKDVFNGDDERLLSILAGQLASAIERIRAEEIRKKRVQELLVITDISREITSVLDTQQVLKTITNSAAGLLNADASGLFIFQDTGELYLVATHGVSQEFVRAINATNLMGEGTAIGRAIKNRAPFQISDILQDSHYATTHLAEMEKIRSILAIPLISGTEIKGGIIIWHRQPRHFTKEEELFLQALANQSVNAIENARLFDEARRRASQQEALNQIITVAVLESDLNSLLATVLDLSIRALGADKGGIWASGYSMVRGFPPKIGEDSRRVASKTGVGTRKTIAVEDWHQVGKDDQLAPWLSHIEKYQICSTLLVPVTSKGKNVGALVLASTQPRRWQQEEIAMMEAVGRQVGSAVERLDLFAEVQEQARQMQQIMDTVPEGVLFLDAERRIILANPAAEQFLTKLLSPEERGLPLRHLGNQDIEKLLDITSGEVWHEIETISAPKYIFETTARYQETHHAGWVIVLRDVTNERENRARVELQDRLATVGQLAAGIAHDFNNIMAAITVYVDLIAMETALSESTRERMSTIKKQIQRASSLIRQILDFSRHSDMEQGAIDIVPFLKELSRLLKRVLPENIHLELSLQPGDYIVNADPTRLQQAIMNLILNARDAMPEGGTLSFCLDRFSLGKGEVPPLPDVGAGDWVRISVKDTGLGIPPNILPHVFDPFFTTKPVGQGTGLGLSQVYGIIKQHGGGIDVSSKVGEGTTFTLYLPAIEEPHGMTASLPSMFESRGSGETVLLVEDDKETLNALKVMLETQNYRVLTAVNGSEALKIYQWHTGNISVVISDWIMPEMGGSDLFYALNNIKPQVQMLFITGHPLDPEIERDFPKDRVFWLQKPFSIQEFTSILQKMIRNALLSP